MQSLTTLRLNKREKQIVRGLLERNSRQLSNGCLEWAGGCAGSYASIWTGERNLGGHRAAAALKQDVKAGSVIRHLCNNSKCVNPEHLAVGTHEENMADVSVKFLQDNMDAICKAATAVKEGSSKAQACRDAGLAYSSLTRRLIDALVS